MDYFTKYQPKREQYWPEVERFFGALPPQLGQQGTLLKNNLAIDYSDTGQFKDILGRPQDYPLLYLHFWLLDDFHFPDGAERDGIERHLFLAMFFTCAAHQTHPNILAEDGFLDHRSCFLEHMLAQQAIFHLAQLFPTAPPSSSFWTHYHTFWAAYSEGMLWEFQPHERQVTSFGEETLLRMAEKLALTKISPAAVALKAGRAEILPQLLAMMDQLNIVFQARQDISTIWPDLKQGRYSYPILRTMLAAGIEALPPPRPEQILGAMVLTGSIEAICQECLARLETCQAIAKELQLPTFSAYFGGVENLVREILDLFSVRTQTPPRDVARKKQSSPLFQPYLDRLSKGLEMAEGYLLSDLTFRESWDVQRGGLFNVAEMTARAFPAGLIIERLSQHGHNLAGQVDEVFEMLAANGFQYYDRLQAGLPDADDLGLLLRLHRYSTQPETQRSRLEIPLGWMKASILPSGEIPVWFKKNGPTGVSIWGHSCAVTEINLLLGLIDYDWEGYQDIIEKSSLNLLARFQANGLGAALYYPALYTLWIVLEWISKLKAQPLPTISSDMLDQALETFLNRLEVETKRPTLTPQGAAFLILACSQPAAAHLFNPRWITLLLKNQRPDGSWPGEPLFLIPHRGSSTWYATHSATTAFCYDALKRTMGR